MTPPAPSMLAGRATSRTTCGCRGRSSSASSTTSSRSLGSTALSSAARIVVLPLPVPPETRNASRADSTARSSASPCGIDRAEGAQRGQVVRGRAEHPQRQAGAVGGDRGQHGVQPDSGLGQPAVDVRAGVVEPTAGRDGQPLGQPAHRGLVGEPQPAGFQAGAAVDPDRGRAADQHVGGARVAQQLVERPGADELLAQQPQRGQHVEVGGDPAGLGAHRGGHRGRRGVAAGRGQPGADAVDQRGVADRLGAGGARVHARLLRVRAPGGAPTPGCGGAARPRGPDREAVDGGGSDVDNTWPGRGIVGVLC